MQYNYDLTQIHQISFENYTLVGTHNCEQKIALFKKENYDLAIFEFDKCYLSNRINLSSLKLEITKAVFFDPNTYLWLYNSFEFSHSVFTRLDPILESEEGMFLLTKNGVFKYLSRTRTCDPLIEGSHRKFSATKLEILSRELVLLASDKGEMLFFDQISKRVIKTVSDFHVAPIICMKSMLKSVDALPLIYSVCEQGVLLSVNVNDLQKPFIKFELPVLKGRNKVRWLEIIEAYRTMLVFTANSIVFYNVFAKTKLIEIQFEEFFEDSDCEIISAAKISGNLLEVEFLICDSKKNLFVLNLLDLDFLRFNLETQTISVKTQTEQKIKIKEFLVFTFDFPIKNLAYFLFGEGKFFLESQKSMLEFQLQKKSRNCLSLPNFVTGLPLKVVC